MNQLQTLLYDTPQIRLSSFRYAQQSLENHAVSSLAGKHRSSTPRASHVSAHGLCEGKYAVLCFKDECANYPILTQEVVTGDNKGILGAQNQEEAKSLSRV